MLATNAEISASATTLIRNRHCPKCQGRNQEQWIENQETELLPVPYFHVVFTLP